MSYFSDCYVNCTLMHSTGSHRGLRGHCLQLTASTGVDMWDSQANEQANTGLQHIKSQLVYMAFDNFVFHLCLLLCLKNKDAQRKIDVSCLSI